MKAEAPPPRPGLEPFREAVAEAFIGDEKVGILSVRVDVWFTISGPWWRRKWIDPTWGAEWILLYEPAFYERHSIEGDGLDDGVELGDDILDDILTSSFQHQGRRYSLRWIDRSVDPELWLGSYGFVPDSRPDARRR